MVTEVFDIFKSPSTETIGVKNRVTVEFVLWTAIFRTILREEMRPGRRIERAPGLIFGYYTPYDSRRLVLSD